METRVFMALPQASRNIYIFIVFALLCSGSAAANANWRRLGVKQIDQTILNNSTTAEFKNTSINAVAAQGVISAGSIISSGAWNSNNQYRSQTSGQEFMLKMHQETADTLPETVADSFSVPAYKQTKVRAKNLLVGEFTVNEDLTAKAGDKASQVVLNELHTLSVFSKVDSN
mgnify:CR=1 FL=1